MTTIAWHDLKYNAPLWKKYAIDQIRSTDAHQRCCSLHSFQLLLETVCPKVNDLQVQASMFITAKKRTQAGFASWLVQCNWVGSCQKRLLQQ